MHISFLKIHVVFSFCIWFGKLFTPTVKHLFFFFFESQARRVVLSALHSIIVKFS